VLPLLPEVSGLPPKTIFEVGDSSGPLEPGYIGTLSSRVCLYNQQGNVLTTEKECSGKEGRYLKVLRIPRSFQGCLVLVK
jgi:hypothetical protein